MNTMALEHLGMPAGVGHRLSALIRNLADQHPIPFLRGTDGMSWFERRRFCKSHPRIWDPVTAEDLIKIRAASARYRQILADEALTEDASRQAEIRERRSA
jgi:hypothetical protein